MYMYVHVWEDVMVDTHSVPYYAVSPYHSVFLGVIAQCALYMYII